MDDSFEIDDDEHEQLYGARLEPIGAPNEASSSGIKIDSSSDKNQQQSLEEEQDLLNISLFALTTHLAQVQFRLRQVVNAPAEQREDLLQSLEDFAFEGLPNVNTLKQNLDDTCLTEYIKTRYSEQKCLLNTLKEEVRDLQNYLDRGDESNISSHSVIEKMKIVLSEIAKKTNLDIDEQYSLRITPAALRQKINVALERITEKIKEKDKVIEEYRIHLLDLEKCVRELKENCEQEPCHCKVNVASRKRANDPLNSGFVGKFLRLFRMFLKIYIGCGIDNETDMYVSNYWGNLRAKLQLAILRVKKIGQDSSNRRNSFVYDAEMTTAVLRDLAPSIRDLMQHGLIPSGVPIILCIPSLSLDISAWKVLLNYYVLKNGDELKSSPARKLSESFNLDIASALPENDEEHLLLTIDRIISLYKAYKRDSDVHFKAFICAALNARKLVTWLSLLFQCDKLVKFHYLPWSYVAKTRFRDSLVSLDVLTDTEFNLPVDYAVRKFLNINDMFTYKLLLFFSQYRSNFI